MAHVHYPGAVPYTSPATLDVMCGPQSHEYSTFTVLLASSWPVGTTNQYRGPTAVTLSLAGPIDPIVDAITISVVFTLWVHAHDVFVLAGTYPPTGEY
jgi:hypothetical protein